MIPPNILLQTHVSSAMAASHYCQKNHLLASFHIKLALLSLVISHGAALAVNYQQFSGMENTLNFTADVYQDKQVLQLTKQEKDSLGRVTYYKQLHLWDSKSGKVTDFNTHFSFVINTPNKTYHGDGITFYLAQPNFPLPVPRDGSGIGLVSPRVHDPAITNEQPFVAVEFDTWVNDWDPTYDHVGIDIKSVRTAYTTQWFCSLDERGYDADISFNSSSNNLSVTFTGYKDNVKIQQSLSYVVDLRDVLPEWVEFGFTSATGLFYEGHTLSSWSFSSSLDSEAPKDESKTWLVIGMSVGAGVLIGVLGLALLVTWKRRNRGREDGLDSDLTMDNDFAGSTGPKKFSYEELARATNYFAEEQKIGEGGFGGVYKGFIRDLNIHVAIKKVSKGSKQGLKEYASEVKIISQLRHKNLVQLIGWCHQQNDLLLIYEFLENGSLDYHLFKDKSLLPWKVRYNIAGSLASALLYLHEEWEKCVIHRDIKSSNVMLDSNFNAKLGDFGLARLMDHWKVAKTTVLAGTYGYLSPESATRRKFSRESDVYSFGVVALEIACGRKPIEPNLNEEEVFLVEWVWELYSMGDHLKAADPRLLGEFDEQEMERLMIVGLWCTHIDYLVRPMIRHAVQVLKFEVPLPTVPTRMPAPTYNAQPTSSGSLSSGTPAFGNNQTGPSSNSSFTVSSQSNTTFEVISPSALLLQTV